MKLRTVLGFAHIQTHGAEIRCAMTTDALYERRLSLAQE